MLDMMKHGTLFCVVPSYNAGDDPGSRAARFMLESAVATPQPTTAYHGRPKLTTNVHKHNCRVVKQS